MDHNLEDSVTMESIENMDFDHSGVVVNQEDITLESNSQVSDIPMDFDTIDDQPILLDGGSEEVIVSDFIGDQFGFQEYSVQGENSSGANITIEENQMGELTTQNEVVDLQYADSVSKATTSQSGIITIKAIPQQRGSKKSSVSAPYPRQVAIAPKPVKTAPNVQYAIAPKPVAIMMNKNAANASKGVAMKSVVPVLKGNTVLAQIGKQLVMVPAGAAGQKIKLSSILSGSSTDSNLQLVRCSPDSAQLIANKKNKPWRAPKQAFFVQGSGQSGADPSNQPAVITKLVPVTGAAATHARYVMQQKTVPISIGGNKVVLTTPPKQSGKAATNKQIISIKTSQSPKMVTSQANMQTKKVVISSNPSQTHSTGIKITTQAGKDNATALGQRTQLQSINVPGKGIQIIKLVTNQPPKTQKSTSKPQSSVTMSGKNFVLTDAKGNIIQMTAEKVESGQPPPLVMAATTTSGTKAPVKGKKLVRIAPVSNKSVLSSACSVLSGTSVSLEEFNQMVEQNKLNNFAALSEEEIIEEPVEDANLAVEDHTDMEIQIDPVDVKPTLASLISDAVAEEESIGEITNVQEVEISYDSTPRKQEKFTEEENTNSLDHEMSDEKQKENLIIVPPNINNNTRDEHNDMYQDDTNTSMDDSNKMHTVVNVEADVVSYLTPQMEQTYSDQAFVSESEAPGMRPRKACNCTKSRCLKLYCDCFANGEFCNNCNCNNCHNNLENEDLRQIATRACLERNPNAFRPKIGKAKSGGPEIIRRHTKGCNCKRSGCLKNYCECYEAKIACTIMCKCIGCRNIEETLERRRDAVRLRDKLADSSYRPPLPLGQMKQPCRFMTPEVIEAVAQCMLATVAERAGDNSDPVEDILLEFSRCMADIISASHQAL